MLASFGDVALGLVYRQHPATASMALAVVVNFIFNILLVPKYGITGAAVATLAAFSVQLAFSSIMAARSGPFWRTFHGLYRVLAASATMALVIGIADKSMDLSDLERLLLFVPAGAVLYGVLALAFGVIPPTYLRYARARLQAQWHST
jgi:O-antigen/teichoic acid export membrane protein